MIPQLVHIPHLATLILLGSGYSADVYALPGRRILKLFRGHADGKVAAREAVAAEIAAGAGVAVATPVATTFVDGRPALVAEHLSGETVLAVLRRAPWRLPAVLRDLAHYQARMHAGEVPEGALPDLDFVIAARLDWSMAEEPVVDAARSRLKSLTRGDRLCHGDLHPGNLMLTDDGPAAIDWSLATRGAPAGDVARTDLLLRFASYGRHLRRWPLLRAARWLSAVWYRLCYRRATGMEETAIEAWRLPVAVAWLHPDTAAHAPALRRFIARRV